VREFEDSSLSAGDGVSDTWITGDLVALLNPVCWSLYCPPRAGAHKRPERFP
jgi:hypothetical protein